MPKRMIIDLREYEVLTHEPTGKKFLVRVDDRSDAGRLMPSGMIWWYDPHRHGDQREVLELLREQNRLEWLK